MSTSSERENRNRATPRRAGAARSNGGKGVAGGEPPYPSDGRCELCGSLPKKAQGLIFDREHVTRGTVTTEYCRGWVCYHCKHLVGIIRAIGLRKLVTYVIRAQWDPAGWPLTDPDRSFLKGYLQERL